MRPETRQSLEDANAAAQEILLIAQSDWQEDRITSLAVERLLMIIGEAFVRIRTSESEVLDRMTDAHKIIGMRNVLAHGYDALDPARVQDAIQQGVPRLALELKDLLEHKQVHPHSFD